MSAILSNVNSLSIPSLSDATNYVELSESINFSDSWRRQAPTQLYQMVSCERRIQIIRQIDNGEIMSECKTGKKWWTTKHHPKREIPQNIYLLGNGTLLELHQKYSKENETTIEYKEFINYTRELIKQGIMY